jgi:hypothetical protein
MTFMQMGHPELVGAGYSEIPADAVWSKAAGFCYLLPNELEGKGEENIWIWNEPFCDD